MIRVGLIESNNLLRTGRSLLLGAQTDIQIVFEEADPNLALSRVGDYLIDVLVVNAKQHGFGGVSYLADLRASLAASGNDSAVLAFSNFFNEETYRDVVLAGADDFIGMDSPSSEFLDKLRAVSKAGFRIEQKLLEKLFRKNTQLLVKSRELDVTLGVLEPWERNVIKRFLRGDSDSTIAKELDLARTRVRKTIQKLMLAGAVNTRNQLAIALMGKVS